MLASSSLFHSVLTLGRRTLSTATSLNFDLSDEMKDLQQAMRVFVKNEVVLKAAHYDKTMEYPWDIIKKAHTAGLINSQIPEEYGGPGLDSVAEVVLAEALGYGCTGITMACMGNDLATVPLLIAASHEIKKKFLPRLIEEPLMSAYCVTEP
ncbi:hypothetical protein FO519_010695, partial [Halicephalobus sp. NKZ332]